MRFVLRMLAGVVAVIGLGVVGFLVGWSIPESGSLEGYYRSGLLGFACGSTVGLLLFAVRATIARRGRRPPQ